MKISISVPKVNVNVNVNSNLSNKEKKELETPNSSNKIKPNITFIIIMCLLTIPALITIIINLKHLLKRKNLRKKNQHKIKV